MLGKHFLVSKTLWTNALAIVGMAIFGDDVSQYFTATDQAAILGVINMILRIITKEPVSWSVITSNKGRASIWAILGLVWMLALVFMLSGCAGSKANKAVTVIEITNASINDISAALESSCQEGRIPPDTCAQIQTTYDRVKSADDAVVHAMSAAIEAGEDPQSSPDYNAAMAELTKAIGDLYNLAGQTGIIKTGGV